MDDFYRLIPDYPGYRVSRQGDVESCWVRRGRLTCISDTWKPLKTFKTRNYVRVGLSRDKHQRLFRVHRLVLLSFVGPAPEGMIASHNDGQPSNNRLENLRWATFQSNADDRLMHGTLSRGESARHAKLRGLDVLEIRRLRTEGWKIDELAARFGVGKSNIGAIIYRRTWKHLLPPPRQASDVLSQADRGLAA